MREKVAGHSRSRRFAQRPRASGVVGRGIRHAAAHFLHVNVSAPRVNDPVQHLTEA
jgi:hypothetical protein